MFDRFTDRAKKVMSLARQEAVSFHHDYIGTEHILLGLIAEGSGVAANVIENLDVNLDKVRLEVEMLAKHGSDVGPKAQLPFSPHAKKLLESAIYEARGLDHNYVGTEHLLLGLLRVQECLAVKVLTNLHLKLDDVRNEVLEFLGAENPQSKERRIGSGGESLAHVMTNDSDRTLPAYLRKIGNLVVELEKIKVSAIAREDFEAGVACRDASALLGNMLTSRSIGPDRGQPIASAARALGFDSFSPNARKIMSLSRQESVRLNHDYIGTEHMLLGLVKEGSGVATKVLARLEVDPENIRREVEKLVKPSTDKVTMGRLPFTPRAKKVLEFAIDEAGQMGNNYVGSGHLLLGLLLEETGLAAQALLNLGLKIEDVRIETVKFLGEEHV